MSSRDPSPITAAVKAEARRLGFDLVGITTPDPPPHIEVYRRWLAADRHGEMRYLATERAIERRADPRRILASCHSILIVGIRHLPPPPARPGAARVAAYALGDDYHDFVPRRLQALVAFLENQAGGSVSHKIYTDTGPVLERDLAQRAGMGWIGKNTCLIHPAYGSYLLLGEVLLGIELEPDPAFDADRCGSCTRCLEACPTQSILPDRTLDARRCLSYLTIELKGTIPMSLRSSQGAWLFGCDRCQQVCPWNERHAEPTADEVFQPRAPVNPPEPLAILRMDPADFHPVFDGSPLQRPRRRGLLRNAAIVAGNSGNPAAVPTLAQALETEREALVRAHAAWALGRIGGRQALAALQAALAAEPDAAVRAEIQAALTPIEAGSAANRIS